MTMRFSGFEIVPFVTSWFFFLCPLTCKYESKKPCIPFQKIKLLEIHGWSLFLATCLNSWTRIFLFVRFISFLILNMLPAFLNILYWKLRQGQVSYLRRQSSWLSWLILYSSIAALIISSIKTLVRYGVDVVQWSLPITALNAYLCFTRWNGLFVTKSKKRGKKEHTFSNLPNNLKMQ